MLLHRTGELNTFRQDQKRRETQKAYDITLVRLLFRSPRPESFAIYKRTTENSPWVPFQFYSKGKPGSSGDREIVNKDVFFCNVFTQICEIIAAQIASCRDTYGLPDTKDPRTPAPREGEETRALCTSEYSDISPLTGGQVPFSTLENRPSNYKFDSSPELQEWVTATDIRITLDRLNTFGDEVFWDPQVLRSYYYAIIDFFVGARVDVEITLERCGAGRRSVATRYAPGGVSVVSLRRI
ncbi:laminin subunit [Homalodisca vitripennis]|nr:laminin subunit [Homalodisca vitripennis]